MIRRMHPSPRTSGFSLIEILIAVVILATGLLALTALQGRLAQASGDAKARSRVATLLTARMDELRAAQYASIPPVMPAPPAAGQLTATVVATCANAAWVCTAQTESGVSDLTVTQEHARFMSVGGVFVASGNQPPNLDPNTAEFKRIMLTATWTDAAGATKRLAIASDASPLSIGDKAFLPEPSGAVGGAPAVVRQDNPAGPGVIPIAIGGGDATAASNPRPRVVGQTRNQSRVETRFDVLTYSGLAGPSVIQRRFETAVVSCSCEYGAGGTNLGEIYRTAQWPAQWTGTRYDVVAPSGNPAAPGQSLAAGPMAGVSQSALCTECCRDHHDDASINDEKFDPARSGASGHYDPGLSPVGTSSGTRYIEACRLIRVDGFWRTASDLYAKHFGLVNTSVVAGQPAKSGAPDPAAVLGYQSFVKGTLGGYDGSAGTIANAPDGGLGSGTISIGRPPPTDERYLHARGLYVDYLHPKARARIIKARTDCTGDVVECMLPFLPFTTINTTELAFWAARATGTTTASANVISVASGSSLIYDPTQPTRGRTNALSTATNNSNADAAAVITRSNAGIAITTPVDLDDQAATASDRQNFRVVAGLLPLGQQFTVRLAGPSRGSTAMAIYDTNTSNDPSVAWANATGNANCNGTFSNPGDRNPNDYLCDTHGALGIATVVRLANYFREFPVRATVTGTCAGGVTVTEAVDVPTFADYRVTGAQIGGASATLTVQNNAKVTEVTEATFPSIGMGSRVDVVFELTAEVPATIATCTAISSTQFGNITWNKSWLTP